MATICDSVQITYKGDGSIKLFTFPFTYMSKEDVDVLLWNDTTKLYDLVARTEWSFANATTVEFNTPPPAPPTKADPADPDIFNVKIARSTDLDDMIARFYPGSAIRAEDLNDDFDQLRLAIQEGLCEVKGNLRDWVKQNFWNKTNETIHLDEQKKGTWIADDKHVATTGAISDRLDKFVQDTSPGIVAPPTVRTPGKFWIDTEQLILSYWDEQADRWVQLANTGPAGPQGDEGTYSTIVSETPPAARNSGDPLQNGDLWFNSHEGEAFIWYVDVDSSQWVSLTKAGEQGPVGPVGGAASIAAGTTTTGAPGTNASVTNSGTSGAAVFNFTIPRGDKGDKGDSGEMTIGTVTTGAAGTNAAVTNTGTTTNATFNFTIPRGDKGDKGDTGSGVTFKGSVDATTAGPAGTPVTGDMWNNTVAGNAAAGWTGVAGTALHAGDSLIFDGTNWHVSASSTQWDRIGTTHLTPRVNTDKARTAATVDTDNDLTLITKGWAEDTFQPAITSGATAPTAPNEGDLWWQPATARMFYFNNTVWVSL